MTKLEQAARQILEAIEGIGFVSDYWDEKITALREALAEQAEPSQLADASLEPVALLQLAEDALVYHTEQTRPIQNTIDALAAIQKFKEKQR